MTQPTSVNIRVTVLVAAAAGLLAAGAAATYIIIQSRYVTSRSDMAAAIPPAESRPHRRPRILPGPIA